MSRFVAGLVYKKRAGSMARKAILAYCAERANDDGSGVWASKSRIAKEVECSKQTVIEVMKSLQADGLLKEVGHKRTPNGYVVEYAIVLVTIRLLPDAVEDVFAISEGEGSNSGPVKPLDPTSQATGPHQSSHLTPPVKPLDPNRPLTVLEPSLNLTPVGDGLFSEIEEPPRKEPDRFDEFWKACPRKMAKDKAKPAYLKALRKVDAETLITAMRRYAVLRFGEDPQYTAHPASWLNAGRWTDEELQPKALSRPIPSHEQVYR